ncbi:hypothetical protein [Thomasclavelia cocleata]|jgi:hypothetical protein|uniref:hypothetical protein n=1 Tax=Thomasclavelia cocleata TaxID=69824 RepID=UPI00255B2D72|nr:hypothetical protein [Thomasclavelia cocleata]
METELFKSYRFEDLYVGLKVRDAKENDEIIEITKILTKKDCAYLYHDENKKVIMSEWYAIEFEENRFFPIEMAEEELLELYGLKINMKI